MRLRVTVGKGGEIELPAELRDHLGMGPGTYCRMLVRDDSVVLHRLEDVHLRCLTLEMGLDTIHAVSSTQQQRVPTRRRDPVLRPLGDRIVVKVLEAEEKTAGGIILPDTAKDKPQEGEVIAVGSGRVLDNGNRVAPEVSVGDRVIFSKYGGTEVKVGDVEYLIIREQDLLAIK